MWRGEEGAKTNFDGQWDVSTARGGATEKEIALSNPTVRMSGKAKRESVDGGCVGLPDPVKQETCGR